MINTTYLNPTAKQKRLKYADNWDVTRLEYIDCDNYCLPYIKYDDEVFIVHIKILYSENIHKYDSSYQCMFEIDNNIFWCMDIEYTTYYFDNYAELVIEAPIISSDV